jgi:hypothetical protein
MKTCTWHFDFWLVKIAISQKSSFRAKIVILRENRHFATYICSKSLAFYSFGDQFHQFNGQFNVAKLGTILFNWILLDQENGMKNNLSHPFDFQLHDKKGRGQTKTFHAIFLVQ